MADIESAVTVKNIHKNFRLPIEQATGIKQLAVNALKGKRGYETQNVLDDISFDIKKGEFFGIIGRNGSGKSTLLKILAGIYTPDSGTVKINGVLTPFIELGVGFNPELTGRENVFLNGALLGFSKTEMLAMYDEIVEFAELDKFMDQKLRNYSSGMQVRLAFSIAIKADTDILLFDEVLAVGDENFQKKCIQTFLDLKQAGKTIILVSHSTGDIERFCDRVLVVDKSKQLGIFNARDGVSLYQELNNESAEAGKVRAKKPKKRWGSGGVKIEKITIENPTKIVHGKSLTININLSRDVEMAQELPVKIGLAFYDEYGFNMSGPNSYDVSIIFPKDKKNITVSYTVSNISFNQGTYKITVAALNNNENDIYDHWTDAASFNVKTDKTYYGKVILDGKWESS